jgi:hypothetical protein
MVDRYIEFRSSIPGADNQLRGHAEGARSIGERRLSEKLYHDAESEGFPGFRKPIRFRSQLYPSRGTRHPGASDGEAGRTIALRRPAQHHRAKRH